MKKIALAVLAVLLVCVVLLFALYGAAVRRQPALLARPPLPLKELDRMAAAWGNTPASAPAAKPAADAAPQPLPKQAPALIRTLTPAEREQFHYTVDMGRPRRMEDKAIYGFCQMAATAAWMGGLNGAGGWYWEAAQEAHQAGDLKAMKAYFREALEYPLTEGQRQWCCAELASLEDDPEVAGRLLEIACATDHYLWLGKALELTKATGSDAAREYYAERVWQAVVRLREQNDRSVMVYESLLDISPTTPREERKQ